MIRVGIYGVENSHAKAFCSVFQQEKYPDIRVTLVGGTYPDTVTALSEQFGIPTENDPEKMAEQVDSAMITCRDGKLHLEAALPFIRRGLPLFIDKPLTVSAEDCEKLIREAKASGIGFLGGSSVKISPDTEEAMKYAEGKKILGGKLTCPIDMESPYSGFFFYCHHLAETMLRVFGYDPREVTAFRTPGGVSGMVKYPDYLVHFDYLDHVYDYAIEVDTDQGVYQGKISTDGIHEKEAEEFVRFVKNGESMFTAFQLAAPVYLSDAMYRSYVNGTTERVGQLPEELR